MRNSVRGACLLFVRPPARSDRRGPTAVLGQEVAARRRDDVGRGESSDAVPVAAMQQTGTTYRSYTLITDHTMIPRAFVPKTAEFRSFDRHQAAARARRDRQRALDPGRAPVGLTKGARSRPWPAGRP